MHDQEEKMAKSKKNKKLEIVRYAAATLLCLVMMFPLYWMLISAFKSQDELLQAIPSLWPEEFRWENFAEVLQMVPIWKYIGNTLFITFFHMLFQMLSGIFAAYGFSRGCFRGKDALFVLVLGALMIPDQVTFLPIYIMISKAGMVNTYTSMIIPSMCSAYFIFMLRQAFMSVDNSYLEAGYIDGVGRVGAIFKILLPMCKPTVITTALITFINGWNSYFWPKLLTTDQSHKTVALGVQELRQSVATMEITNYNHIMAGATISVVPICILFFFLQKYIVSGMSKAAMK